MEKGLRFISILSISVFCIIFFSAEYISKKEFFKNTADTYNIKALKIPKNLNFAGEKVPTDRNDIKERMDRELLVNTYWQSNGLLLIKRAHKYFPIIEPILKEYGLPDDFKYLAIAESGFQNITSSSGASGFWQFLKSSAREYGLEVNNNVINLWNCNKSCH